MNPFDQSILAFLNSFAHRWWLFDTTVSVIVDAPFLKGGVVMMLIWWEWFRGDGDILRRREILFASLVSCFVALFVARGLANMLPFRERPVHNLSLQFVLPYSVSQKALIGWSSFPSDHATLFFALATALFFVSRRVGVWAMIYVFVVVCIPRVYVGIHYPTDILAGMVLGGGIVWAGNRPSLRELVARPGMRWLAGNPASFYAVLFLLTYQIVTLFEDVRLFGGFFLYLVKHGVSGG